MGYGSKALEILEKFFGGQLINLDNENSSTIENFYSQNEPK